MVKTLETDVVIIGSGTAGMYALREVRRAGRKFLMIDHGPLGTVCARVGCMPSKVALHAAANWQAALNLDKIGGSGMHHLQLDGRRAWAALRRQRDGFAHPTAARTRESAGEHLLEGRARFLAADHLAVELNDGGHCEVKARAIIIAVGSRPVVPAWLDDVRDHVITTDDLFELENLPESIGILGLGVIGLEMGLALARLGVTVTGIDVAGTIGGIVDPEISARAIERLGREFEMWLQTQTRLSRTSTGVMMETDGGRRAEVKLLMAALGRCSNVDRLGLADAGFIVDKNGVPAFDPHTMQVGKLPVFIAGDANNSVPLMHEAGDEGLIAGFNASQLAADASVRPQAFIRKTPLAIAFTDPDIVSVGARLSDLDADRTVIGAADGLSNGRSRVLHEPLSLLRVYVDKADGRLLGAAMLAARGEHLAHLLALAIERGETAASLLEMPYYHPVVEEMLRGALQNAVAQLGEARCLPLGLRVLESAEREQIQAPMRVAALSA
ncbi:MAG TPA: dihydrolipoyl dehydrogenase [Paraburkholderia sp.]|nr:dihydrolipoyl dehydrogenase [Paraburkholderia sp.]